MNELALFAGSGGGCLASRWLLGHRIVCYVEREWYRAKSIRARIEDGLLDDAPIRGDIRHFDGTTLRGTVDLVTAGFPCQPFSVAGKGLGELDPRNAWPDTIRVVREVGPRLVFLENVPALLVHPYFGRILGDLRESGFDAEWATLLASTVGAPHQRERLWILAYAQGARAGRLHLRRRRPIPGPAHTDGHGQAVSDAERIDARRLHPGRGQANGEDLKGPQGRPPRKRVAPTRPVPHALGERGRVQPEPLSGSCAPTVATADGSRGFVAHTMLNRLEESGDVEAGGLPSTGGWWATEPDVGRLVNGLASRVDRLAALGDGQVPLVAAIVFQVLMGRLLR